MAKRNYLTSPPNLTGMPPGVPYIIGNEAAERFSYYGMKSVLTVFMAHYILNSSGVLAPMSENQAYMYSHTFVLGVYALPVLGAILADGFLGKYWTILSLSIVYCLGNLTLACMATTWGIGIGQRTMLMIGLSLICLGAGGIKPCVSANVGDQFGESNKHLLSKMFGWFYFSINAGSFISSILCPWLRTLQAEKMDLHWMGMDLIAAQVQTANPILILIFIPIVNYVIYPAIDKVFPLTPLRKIGIGLFITALSFVVIVMIQGWIDAGLRPSINWQLLAYVILTLGEAMVSITGLEFSYTQAPNSMKSSVMALWLFTVASGEGFVALVNKWILGAGGANKVSAYQYFTFFTWLMFGAAIVFVIVACFYKGRTYLQSQLTPDEVATEPILHGGTPS